MLPVVTGRATSAFAGRGSCSAVAIRVTACLGAQPAPSSPGSGSRPSIALCVRLVRGGGWIAPGARRLSGASDTGSAVTESFSERSVQGSEQHRHADRERYSAGGEAGGGQGDEHPLGEGRDERRAAGGAGAPGRRGGAAEKGNVRIGEAVRHEAGADRDDI